MPPDRTRLAFLHIAPRPGELARNRERVRAGVLQAADADAEWVLTPELSTSGYGFAKLIGTAWIEVAPDPWTAEIAEIAAERGVAVFLAMAERDAGSGLLHNSVLAFDGRSGSVGSHRKVNTLKVGSEAWSSPGSAATTAHLAGFGKVGLLICADACSPELATAMKAAGARAIISCANWAPGQWGPAGEWEAITKRTGLPLFVCNRTGIDGDLSFEDAESVAVAAGTRQLSFSAPSERLLLVDWDFTANRLISWRDADLP